MDGENRLKKVIKDNPSIKTTMNNLISNDIREGKINFDYGTLEGLEEKEMKELVNCEKSLLFQGKQLGVVSLEIGKALHRAKEILIKNHDDSFMKWYTALGLKKDQVSIFMNRYKLALDFPEQKENIIGLSDRVIKEGINKKNPQNLIERIVKGEITTAEQIRNERKNNSAPTEIVEEAEIVGETYKVVFTVSIEMIDNLEKKLNKIKRNINKNLGIELKSYHKLERVLEILGEVK